LTEVQEAYKNSKTGVQKVAHEKNWNDKGYREVRERVNGCKFVVLLTDFRE
jgi:hypothetical protein